MASINPAFVTVNPSLILPDILMQYNQRSGAFSLLGGGEMQVRLSDVDKAVYIRTMSIDTKSSIGQSPGNSLPSVGFTMAQISTPTYLHRARAEYDHHDLAAAGAWGLSLPEAYRLGMRQAIFQQNRNALLYGVNAANGEGLLNTAGATATNLPADSGGHTTILTYDNGEMATFLLKTISDILSNLYMLGNAHKVVILAPQRVIAKWTYYGVVQLTNFQREGAGSGTIATMAQTFSGAAGGDIEFAVDDTLIGKGNGGKDAIIICVPELEVSNDGVNDTNEFAKLQPGLLATTIQLCDKVAPTEIYSPLAGGATDVLAEQRIISGWGIRPEAIFILSATYS
ncbi:MAG: hypothetical protein RL755_74 [Pseudomonadota bacterium]|jgi:hypothetical protein